VTVSATVHVTAAEGNDGDNGNNGDDRDDSSAGGGNTLPTTGGSGRTMVFEIAGGVGAVVLGTVLLWLTRAWRRRSSN
jgi:hypothetical protein